MAETRRCLILIVRPRLALAILPACPERSFVADSSVFSDQTGADFIGFYDWIRSSSGQVLGVRETLSEEFEKLGELIPTPPYVRRERSPIRLEFFFSEERDFDPVASSDQDFLMNRLMRNEEGEIALTFGIDAEVEDDLVAGALSADWIEVESVD